MAILLSKRAGSPPRFAAIAAFGSRLSLCLALDGVGQDVCPSLRSVISSVVFPEQANVDQVQPSVLREIDDDLSSPRDGTWALLSPAGGHRPGPA
jgi:hypothetical protein